MKTNSDSSQPSPVFSVPSVGKGLSFTQAESPTQIAQARELFLEYAQSLGFSLCFQNFDKELAGFPATTLLLRAACFWRSTKANSPDASPSTNSKMLFPK